MGRPRGTTPSYATIRRSALALAASLTMWSCGSSESPTAPVVTTGSVTVTVTTTGPDAPASYTVALDGGPPRPVDANGTTTFTPLSVGSHTVTLASFPANCVVAGANPRTAEVSAGSSAGVAFSVTCAPLTGGIEVRTTTSGDGLDPDGYTVGLDGTSSLPIGPNASITFDDVTVGTHSLTVGGIAANCAVTGDNPAETAVKVDETVVVDFDLTCTALTGDLRVTANTTGNPLDPDGYQVSVDGGTPVALGVNGDTLTFEALTAGDRSVLLSGIDPGCVVTVENPSTATVPAEGETLAVFDVACTTELGALELTTVTTGLDTDPDGYTVSLDGGTSQEIGTDDVVLFPNLTAGGHSLLLGGIASNCSVQGPNPSMPIVLPNATADITTTVDCEEIPNLVPTATISSPDTTRAVAPPSVAPGDPVTFTGAAADPEDGPLTGGSLVWTSNLDGEIGTGEMFVTSSLSEGQHTVSLTATDSEAATGTETVLVIVTPPTSAGYQVTFRLAEGTMLTPGQASAIGDAVAKLESIVVGDVPDQPIAFAAGACGPGMPVLDESVDDLLIYLSVVVIDGPGGILGAAGPCFVRLGSLIPAVGVMIFDSADFAGLEASGQVDEVWGHEAMHIMGFGTIWDDLEFLEDPTSPGNGGTSGNDTYFDGPVAITQFGVLDPDGDYTGGNVVPVENNDAIFGPGSLDSHWRESVFLNELMTPAISPGPNPLSILTIGQFEDLGYTVDYGPADPYSPMFTLRADGPVSVRFLGDDIWRGPLWVGSPGGKPHRIR